MTACISFFGQLKAKYVNNNSPIAMEEKMQQDKATIGRVHSNY